MAPYPTQFRHNSDSADRQEPVWPVASTASLHNYTHGKVYQDKPACGTMTLGSDFNGNVTSQMYTQEHLTYTVKGSVGDEASGKYTKDMCCNQSKFGFGNRSIPEDSHNLNIPGHFMETSFQISNGELLNEINVSKHDFTKNSDNMGNIEKRKTIPLISANFLSINSKERNSVLETKNRDNIQRQISPKSVSTSFRNSPRTSVRSSKHPPAAVLPPCRICGARASGLHYGVNSCEACKGFFRRALKRPVVFKCSKGKKCDVKGNKRSTCRFCRYRKCLSLGMARESIKTGRYSYKKRTRDTIEVKRLQKIPDTTSGELDLDSVTKNLLRAHDYLIVSTTDAPSDWIYQKQLEYHNIYLLYKKFGNHPELISEQVAGRSFGFENQSRPSDKKDCPSNVTKSGQQPSPLRSWSYLSSDSEFVEEAVTNGYTDAISSNGHFGRLEDPHKCKHNLKGHAKEYEAEIAYVHDTKQYSFEAVKKLEQCSASKQMCPFSFYRPCSLCGESSSSLDSDPVGKPFSEEDSQRINNVCCCQNGNRTNCSACCRVRRKRKTTTLKQIDQCRCCDECLPANTFRNLATAPYTEHCFSMANCNKCGKRTNTISQDVSDRKQDNVMDKLVSGSSNEVSRSLSEAAMDKCSTQGEKLGSVRLNRTFNDTGNDDPNNNIPDHPETAESSPYMDAGINAGSTSRVGKLGFSLRVGEELEREIARRAKTWIQGYVDFAREIPGFSNLPPEDQSALLKHAWDEVWLLGAYRGYNQALGVAITPRGTCVHVDEMETAWGGHYARFAFIMAAILKRYSVSRQLMILLKAACIVAPDRCPLMDAGKVSDIHWMIVSCLQRHAEKTHPKSCQIFPRLISILTSLRELSESAKRDMGSRNFMCGYNILSQTLMPF